MAFRPRLSLSVAALLLLTFLAYPAAAQAQPETPAADPLPDADGDALAAGRWEYATVVESGERRIEGEAMRAISQAVSEGRPVWRVVTRVEGLGQTATDTTEIDRTTLRPVRRISSTGDNRLSTRFAKERAEVTMHFGGQSSDVSVDLDAPTLGDDEGGLDLFLAGLPLAVGYEATLPTFDPLSQQVLPMRIAVTGAETIETPAGAFETFVVEITPVHNERTRTLYLRQDAPHVTIKKTQPLPPQMGEGTSTLTLVGME